MPGQVGGQDATKILLGRPVGRPIVVGQVEVGDAQVERPPDDGPLDLRRVVATEVLPQAEGKLGQLQPAAAGAAVLHPAVSIVALHSRHPFLLRNACVALSQS
jgi:hypothetical protein